MTQIAENLEGRALATSAVHAAGEVVLYRLHDVGYEIDLERVFALLGDRAPERARPARGEAQAIRIPNPPVDVGLGGARVRVAGAECEAQISARVFDFGVVSLRARTLHPDLAPWDEFSAWASAHANARDWSDVFGAARRELLERIGPAIERGGEAPVSEDYAVYRVSRLAARDGRPLPATALSDEAIAPLLLGETRPLTAGARRDLLSPRFSYHGDDLAVLSWSAALVVEPAADDHDVQYVLEFANAQLLELRYYDARLDEELPRMYARIQAARRGFRLLGRRYSEVLGNLQGRVAEITEVVERTENALKMTDDVYLARIYAAALEIFRDRAWRQGIDRKLGIVRDAYAMLNGESQARRAEAVEWIIVILILFEIVYAFLIR